MVPNGIQFIPNFVKIGNLVQQLEVDTLPDRKMISLTQWYSTGGTRRHLRGYVKFKISIYILFPE